LCSLSSNPTFEKEKGMRIHLEMEVKIKVLRIPSSEM